METKKWYQSQTMWAGILMVVHGVLSAFGLLPQEFSTASEETGKSLPFFQMLLGTGILGQRKATKVIE